jgi:hypothetical protein
VITTSYARSLANVGTGVIYAVIVGMWALVLIPMWLRRHDEAQESKSADRFARAMGTLRRDEPATLGTVSHREVMMPGRPAASHDSQVSVSGSTVRPAAQAAARRRRVLTVLVGLLLVTVVVALLRRVPMWTIAVPAVLVVGFFVTARRQVARTADIRRRRDRRSTLADAARAAEARLGAAEGRARRGGRVVDPAPVAEQARVAEPVPAHAVASDQAWHAVPTTLPTYVTAPRATRMPRVIDLTTPGSWSGAAMVAQARETLATESDGDDGMRVETFEIAVPRDPAVRAGVLVEPQTYADRFVEDDLAVEAWDDDDDLETLLEDPRTGVDLPAWRRAANG